MVGDLWWSTQHRVFWAGRGKRLAPRITEPTGTGDVVVKNRIFVAGPVVYRRDKFARDVAQGTMHIGRMVRHQLAHDALPRLQQRLVPLGEVFAGTRADERVLDPAPRAAIRMPRPVVDRIGWHCGACMGMAHKIAVDPASSHMARHGRVEDQAPGIDIGLHALHQLLLRVVHLEYHMAVVQRDVKGNAALAHQRRNPLDPAEMLRPHIDVDFMQATTPGRAAYSLARR